ncbi:hypothetical protein AAC387_Pa01g2649 [Persea americana]
MDEMKEKIGCTKINICPPLRIRGPEMGKKAGHGCFSFRRWIQCVWNFCKEDSNRVIFSLKAGFAVLLASLLVLVQVPYETLGTHVIWAIITVAIMFEYTVGATFNRGFNRALGSLLAAIIGIAVIQAAASTNHVIEPVLMGLSMFIMGALTSFMRQRPSLTQYDPGFRVALFTFCLIIGSGYRMGNPVRIAMNRLYSIAIGGIIAVLVNVLIVPAWAGEQLHEELVKSFDSVADSLEECVKKYLGDDGSNHPEFSTTVNDDFADEPAFKKCRTLLNSSDKFDSLMLSAKWEPPHGKFWQIFYPWSEYVKVGAILRYCAYEVMALHGVLHSEIQAPYNLRISFQAEIQDASSKAAALVRSLSKDISNMTCTPQSSLLKRVHRSTEYLQRSINTHSYQLIPSHDLYSSRTRSAKLSTTLSDFSDSLESLEKLTGDLKSPSDPQPQNAPSVTPGQAESYHKTMKKNQRLHSWPSIEIDKFEGEEGRDMNLIPRMRALESTATLSLATFTSLLIEFVARLDHLVDAVNELARMAKFKHMGINEGGAQEQKL